MHDELTKIEKIALVALQGLLASGHYTKVDTASASDEETPELRSVDHGSNWKKEGAPTRMMSYAASDAFIVARDFLNESAIRKEMEDSK